MYHGLTVRFAYVECRELLGVSPGIISSCISESANISADGARLATGVGAASPGQIINNSLWEESYTDGRNKICSKSLNWFGSLE